MLKNEQFLLLRRSRLNSLNDYLIFQLIRTTFWTCHSHEVRPDDGDGAERARAKLDVEDCHGSEHQLEMEALNEAGRCDPDAKGLPDLFHQTYIFYLS